MLNKNKHRIHLIQILTYIYKNSRLASSLGFKGGTAAYLFYDLPRFSTDLDFDLIENTDAAEIMQLIDQYISKEYKILDKWDKHHTILYKLSYGADEPNIKLEISKRGAGLFNYNYKNLYGNTIQVITPEHLIVQKLIALRNRKIVANRDIFDIHFFLSGRYASKVDYDLLQKITETNAKDFLQELVRYLTDNKPKKILNGLGEVVNEDQKDWIKNSLFDQTINLIQMQIDGLYDS